MTAGAKLSSTDNNEIQLVYPDGDTVTFDRRIKTKDGWVSGVDVKPITGKPAKQEQTSVAAQVTRGINAYRRQLGHPNERIMRTTAEAFGIKLTGKFQKYEDCAIEKARQKMSKRCQERKRSIPADASAWTYHLQSIKVCQGRDTGSYFWTSTRTCVDAAFKNKKTTSQQLLWLL